MPYARFPLRTYLKRIADMEQEVRFWRYHYQQISSRMETSSESYPYERRAYLLEQLEPQLHALYHQLEQLPRLS